MVRRDAAASTTTAPSVSEVSGVPVPDVAAAVAITAATWTGGVVAAAVSSGVDTALLGVSATVASGSVVLGDSRFWAGEVGAVAVAALAGVVAVADF